MRIFKTKTGQSFDVNPLTRKQIRDLRAEHDIDLMNLSKENASLALDMVIDLSLNGADKNAVDSLPYVEALNLFQEILSETFGSEKEEKN